MCKDLFHPTIDFSALNIAHLLTMAMIWALMKFSNLTFFFNRLYMQSILFIPLIYFIIIYLLRDSFL